ncbi:MULTISPECIES: hypothetical protein [Haloarcula]|uniref:hypothetical protein n=1 Tax=Haloarcula TaxID=2237 RepID=UPI0023EBFE15|nr:hypothetical protein [Halomicroarcula sp. XH51]
MTGDRLDRLAEHIQTTGERPVERSAARWLGEAEAIATDLAESDLDADARAKRLDQLDHLLSNVETTGDEEADEHLESARDLLDGLRES